MSLRPDYICHKFRNWLLNESGLAWERSLKDWTFKVKEYFGKLGEEETFHSLYTSKNEKEYLVDIVWRCDKPSRHLGLAMESELSKNKKDILEDFEKLVDIKALLKVGLFHLRPNANESDMLEEMRDILNKQVLMFPNEKYLVIFLRYNYERKEIIMSAYDLDFKGTSYRKVQQDFYPFPQTPDN